MDPRTLIAAARAAIKWQAQIANLQRWASSLPPGSGSTRFYETARPEKTVADSPGGKNMRNSLNVARVLVLASALFVPAAATAGGLESFLDNVEIRASANIGAFKADLSLTFGVSEGTVDGLFEVMSKPSDVYMCLRIGEVADQPIDRVVEEHKRHKGQGWGVIAKNLGIKPGSDEFHALKTGTLPLHTGGGSSGKKDKGGKSRK